MKGKQMLIRIWICVKAAGLWIIKKLFGDNKTPPASGVSSDILVNGNNNTTNTNIGVTNG